MMNHATVNITLTLDDRCTGAIQTVAERIEGLCELVPDWHPDRDEAVANAEDAVAALISESLKAEDNQ